MKAFYPWWPLYWPVLAAIAILFIAISRNSPAARAQSPCSALFGKAQPIDREYIWWAMGDGDGNEDEGDDEGDGDDGGDWW